ncbi:beta-ketoacyl synthase N-terminal-like domain-containing protein [Methylogaea oryzae]|uniref:beta-ketoacyl synthase N-terminal-like domain-containing protein n=1 Tax=Methylogaea oryzae TaxID=1295382 RepID=UPI0006CFCA8E
MSTCPWPTVPTGPARRRIPPAAFFGLTASDKDYGATRISYALDLTGPSLTVQSACSGSLAALHMAVEALLSGQCDMALAGGASLLLPQGAYLAAPG